MTASKTETNFAGATSTTITNRYVTVDFSVALAEATGGYDDSALNGKVDELQSNINSLTSDIEKLREELNKEEESSGCGSAIGLAGTAVALVAVASIIAVIRVARKKKKD